MTPMRKISPMNQSADLLTKSRRSDRRDPPRGASGRTVMDAHSLIHRDVPRVQRRSVRWRQMVIDLITGSLRSTMPSYGLLNILEHRP